MTKHIRANVSSDTTIWDKIMAAVRSMKTAHVKVGVMASAGETENGEFTLAELAAVHEFGSPANGIPERSFIRSTFRERGSELEVVTKKLAKQVLDGGSVHDALSKLGLWGATAVRSQITSQRVRPQLVESEAGRRTIARKGSSVTLVDTGQLANAISYEVEE